MSGMFDDEEMMGDYASEMQQKYADILDLTPVAPGKTVNDYKPLDMTPQNLIAKLTRERDACSNATNAYKCELAKVRDHLWEAIMVADHGGTLSDECRAAGRVVGARGSQQLGSDKC